MKTSYSTRHLGCVLSGIALTVVAIAMPAHATVIFDDGGEHDIDTPFEDFQVYDLPPGTSTTVWIHPGGDVRALDGISVSVFGHSGVAVDGTLRGDLALFDSSSGIMGRGLSEPIVGGNVEVNGRSDLFVQLGTIAGKVELKDRSQASIWGGIFQGDVECQDTCDMVVFADVVFQSAVKAQDEGEIYVEGGTFQGPISAEGAATVMLRGRDFLVNGMPVDYGPILANEGSIEGTLFLRGDSLSTTFTVSDGAQIVLIPEPSTILLAGIALLGILLYQRRR